MSERCVCCGAEIPEGYQVCHNCEGKTVTIYHSVVMSMRPKWWRKINAGLKNVEVRKSWPTRLIALDTRDNKGFWAAVHVSGTPGIAGFIHFYEITTWKTRILAGSGMTEKELERYAKGKPVYGWCLDKVCKADKLLPLNEYCARAPQSWEYFKIKMESIWV